MSMLLGAVTGASCNNGSGFCKAQDMTSVLWNEMSTLPGGVTGASVPGGSPEGYMIL